MTALPTAQKEEALRRKMAELGIASSDLDESFVRASGPGGQHVNKTSTAVLLKHLPSGLAVKCGQTRSQKLNRFLALRILLEKIEAGRRQAANEARFEREKIRRQRRRPSRGAQEGRLRTKKHESERKLLRKNLKGDHHD